MTRSEDIHRLPADLSVSVGDGACEHLPGLALPALALQSTDGGTYGTHGQTALRFGLANPDIACVVFGLAELAHLDEALAAAEMGPLPQAALDQLNTAYAAEFGRL